MDAEGGCCCRVPFHCAVALGVLNLSKGEAKARVEQADQLMPRRSLTGEVLIPRLPATAAGLAAGELGPGHLRVITAIMRRIRRRPPVERVPDLRSSARRNADALVEAMSKPHHVMARRRRDEIIQHVPVMRVSSRYRASARMAYPA
ncbi:MAG TPA: DUF222 domain-containing protein [Pseudonocardiaceae bacterium]|jgi:hypothetical protein